MKYAIGGEIRIAYERSSCDNGGDIRPTPTTRNAVHLLKAAHTTLIEGISSIPMVAAAAALQETAQAMARMTFPLSLLLLLHPTPPLHTSISGSSHFPYAFNPNHIPLPSSLLPTNWMHAPTLLSRKPAHTPPVFFNNIPTHFPSFPTSNPQKIPLFPNHNLPPFYAHTPPFFTHDPPSTSTRFQYSTPPSKFPPACI